LTGVWPVARNGPFSLNGVWPVARNGPFSLKLQA
jgi:hypothetical protein